MLKAENISKIYKISKTRGYHSDREFWALKNVNFEIKQGDKVALKGDNGSGKSTLLKIISKITAPTTGTITGQGRVISMLEIGTGFHRDLTGMQNIYLNGAMLGMSKKEIQKELNTIIHFAEAHEHIHIPVKRYSSGQYMRLAFSVAAHLPSEILILDEVLAVGDTKFQQKCSEKLSDLNLQKEKTILWVSHNAVNFPMSYNKEIVLENGGIV